MTHRQAGTLEVLRHRGYSYEVAGYGAFDSLYVIVNRRLSVGKLTLCVQPNGSYRDIRHLNRQRHPTGGK